MIRWKYNIFVHGSLRALVPLRVNSVKQSLPSLEMARSEDQMLLVRQIDEQEFASMEKAWNTLLVQSRSNTVFLTWEWLYTWWQCFKGSKSLFILSIWDEDHRLVGIVPLFVTKERYLGMIPMKVVRFMGVEWVSSEYLDFILYPGQEQAAIEAVVAYLESHKNLWDVAVFSDMLEDSENLSLLRTVLMQQRVSHLVRAGEICPYITLPDSYEAYRKTLSKNMRYHIGRRTRGLSKLGKVQLIRCDEVAKVAPALDRLFELHHLRWMTRNHVGNFSHEAVRRFHHHAAPLFAEKGWLRFRFLSVNNEPVGVLYAFGYDHTFYYYQSGLNPDLARWSPGAVLMGLCIEEAIASGFTEFDYLRGDESYKWKWTKTFRRTVDLHLYQNRFKPRLVHLCDRAQGNLKTYAKRLRHVKQEPDMEAFQGA